MSPSTVNRPFAGALWMLASGVSFIGVNGIVKYLGTALPAAEGAFLRYGLGLVFLVPMLRPLLTARLDRRAHGVFAARGFFHALGVILWFFAMARIPIAEVQAINYLSPVLVTVGAAIFLGERLSFRRIGAVVVALIGVVIILRPGFRTIEPGHVAMLGVAVLFAGSYLSAKKLTELAAPPVIVAMLSIWVTIWMAPFALVVWRAPSWAEVGLLLVTAGFATLGHLFMTNAFRLAPVTVTQPVTFLQLLWGTLMGYLFFGEAVDVWVITGGLMIIAAIAFITWREAVLNRRGITPPVNATKV